MSIGGPAPENDSRVDSVSYYTHEFAESNKQVSVMHWSFPWNKNYVASIVSSPELPGVQKRTLMCGGVGKG
jgi:hypothetical protein